MVDEAKLRSPIHSTFQALFVPHAVRLCGGEELDPFCLMFLIYKMKNEIISPKGDYIYIAHILIIY